MGNSQSLAVELPADGGDGPEALASRRRGRRTGALVAVALTVALVLVWVVTPGAVRTSSAIGASAAISPGQTIHFGFPGMVDQDITVLSARPRVFGAADVDVNVCRRHGDAMAGAIGSGRGVNLLERSCKEVEPLARGTRLPAEIPDGRSLDYVVVTLRPTGDEVVYLCGVTMLYRSGFRIGFARNAGDAAVIYPEGREQPVELASRGRPCW